MSLMCNGAARFFISLAPCHADYDNITNSSLDIINVANLGNLYINQRQ